MDKNNVNEDEYLLEIFPEKASPLEGEDLLWIFLRINMSQALKSIDQDIKLNYAI